jgi:hypothetical protein
MNKSIATANLENGTKVESAAASPRRLLLQRTVVRNLRVKTTIKTGPVITCKVAPTCNPNAG